MLKMRSKIRLYPDSSCLKKVYSTKKLQNTSTFQLLGLKRRPPTSQMARGSTNQIASFRESHTSCRRMLCWYVKWKRNANRKYREAGKEWCHAWRKQEKIKNMYMYSSVLTKVNGDFFCHLGWPLSLPSSFLAAPDTKNAKIWRPYEKIISDCIAVDQKSQIIAAHYYFL